MPGKTFLRISCHIFESFAMLLAGSTLRNHQLCQKIGKKWRKYLLINLPILKIYFSMEFLKPEISNSDTYTQFFIRILVWFDSPTLASPQATGTMWKTEGLNHESSFKKRNLNFKTLPSLAQWLVLKMEKIVQTLNKQCCSITSLGAFFLHPVYVYSEPFVKISKHFEETVLNCGFSRL